MLPRAALRSIKPSSLPSYHLHLRNGASSLRPLPTSIRTYASKPSRPPPPSLGAKAKPKQAPRAPSQTPASTGAARQTSPGTSVPRGQPIPPKDGIRPSAPAGAAAAASASSIGSSSPETPIQGSRPHDATATPQQPLQSNAAPQEPIAQKADLDEPPVGGIRDAAQSAQATSENSAPPPEPPSEPEPPHVEADAPKQALPDLRQGIPSTFDFEFGSAGKQKQAAKDTEGKEEPFDLTEEAATEGAGSGRRGGEDREYSREEYETSLDRRRAQVMSYLYLAMAAAATAGGAYLARPFGSGESVPAGLEPSDAAGWSPGKMYTRIRARMGSQVGYYTEPSFPKLLPDVPEAQRPPFTLVLSLEDLMIHTTWDRKNGYRTAKRPGIDYFVRYLSPYFELVLFTSVPIAMADPVVKKLDPYHFIMWPLGREATKYENGEYVKDLDYLNRDLSKTIIIDTHAPHVKNQPENAIVLPKWHGDPKDPHSSDLVALIPFLEYIATMGITDVRDVLKSFEGKNIPEEFARREAVARAEFNKQLETARAKAPKHSLGSLLGGSLGLKPTPAMQGGMMLGDGQSVAEGLREGKMLSDQIREQGKKQYEFLEQQIRENGAKWLKEEEEEQKKMMELQMKEMKKGALGWFGGSS